MASLLKQLLWAQFGEGTSNQQPTMLPSPTTPVILNSQNLGANLITRPQETASILMTHPIMLVQVLATIDLAIEGSHEVKSSNHPEKDKWVA